MECHKCKQIEDHTELCHECEAELESWALIEDELVEMKRFDHFGHVSIVDKVMDRLRSEEKWTAPLSRHLSTVTDRLQKPFIYVSSIAFVLFAAFYIYLMTGISLGDQTAFMLDAGIQQAKLVEPMKNAVNIDDVSIVASISQPIAFAAEEQSADRTIVAFSIFGCIASVISLGWVLRTMR